MKCTTVKTQLNPEKDGPPLAKQVHGNIITQLFWDERFGRVRLADIRGSLKELYTNGYLRTLFRV